MENDKEVWRDVSGYGGIYQVSNQGRVRRTRGRQHHGIMNQWQKNGYLRVRLTATEIGKREIIGVHRLVAAAFAPNAENKPVVNHIDCNPLNNRWDNLEWCTQAENIKHSRDLGRYPDCYWKGKRNPRMKLSDETAQKIRNEYASGGISYAALAEKYGTNKKTVMRISRGEIYNTLPPAPEGE